MKFLIENKVIEIPYSDNTSEKDKRTCSELAHELILQSGFYSFSYDEMQSLMIIYERDTSDKQVERIIEILIKDSKAAAENMDELLVAIDEKGCDGDDFTQAEIETLDYLSAIIGIQIGM